MLDTRVVTISPNGTIYVDRQIVGEIDHNNLVFLISKDFEDVVNKKLQGTPDKKFKFIY